MGYLINFEGIDLAGKGTQVVLLEKDLTQLGLTVASLHFPVLDTPVGRLIEDFLAGRSCLPPEAVQMLYSANRYELREKIVSLSLARDVVILDRYSPSGWVYGMTQGLERLWLEGLDARLPKAHLSILLDLPPEQAAARKRATGKDVLERDRVFQAKVRENYCQLAGEAGWLVVEASGEIAEVRQRLLAVVQKWLGEHGVVL